MFLFPMAKMINAILFVYCTRNQSTLTNQQIDLKMHQNHRHYSLNYARLAVSCKANISNNINKY